MIYQGPIQIANNLIWVLPLANAIIFIRSIHFTIRKQWVSWPFLCKRIVHPRRAERRAVTNQGTTLQTQLVGNVRVLEGGSGCCCCHSRTHPAGFLLQDNWRISSVHSWPPLKPSQGLKERTFRSNHPIIATSVTDSQRSRQSVTEFQWHTRPRYITPQAITQKFTSVIG